MKKLISILLVAMLIIGMFPATVSAVDTQIVFNLGANGSASHNDGSSKTSYSATVDGYTLSITNGSNMYTGARDAKGNSCIKLGATSKAGSFKFTVPDDVTSVVIAVAKYKSNSAKVTINGTATTLSKNSNDGAYDEITVDTSSNKTVSLTTVSGGYRAMVNTITFIISGGATEPDEPECEHTKTNEMNDGYAAQCGVPGKTNSVVCADCGETVTEQKEIPALTHSYVDGFCERCGKEEPAGYVLVTDVTELEAGDQVIVVAANANYAMGALSSSSNNFSQVKIEKNDNVIVPTDGVLILTLEEGNKSGTFAFYTGSKYLYAASSGSNYLKEEASKSDNSSWKIEITEAGVATVKAQGTYTRNWMRYNNNNGLFSCYGSGQQDISIYKMSGGTTDPEEPACTHELVLKTEAEPATCTKPGKEAYYECACGETVSGGQEIPALNHSNVDGICTRCGLYETQAELMVGLPGSGDKIIIHHVSSNNALGLEVKDDDLVGISATPAENKLPYYTSVAVLTVGVVDGAYTLEANGKYLTTDANNALSFADTLTDNGLWTIALTDGKFIITNANATNSDGEALALEYYNNAFTTYKTNTTNYYQMQFYLVEKGACQCTNTQEQNDGYAATCTEPGMTNSVKCLDCGATVTARQEIPATGHNYVDDVCSACGNVQVLADYVLVTNRNEITDGQYVIVANVNGAYYAMNNAIDSGKFLPVTVEVSGNTVTTADAPVWTIATTEDGYVTLQTEAGYLNYNSSTNFKLANTAYTWSVEAGATAGTFILNATEATRGIYYQIGNKFGAYANSNANNKDYCAYLQLYKYVQPVVAANGNGYNSLAKAIAAGENNLKLYANVNADVVCQGDLYLDLNGFSVQSLTVNNGTLYACDSKATTSSASGAAISALTGNVEVDNTANGVRYIALNKNGTYTFHVLEMQVTAISLRTTAAGVYYKAKIICDEELSKATQSYGMVLSTYNMPGADFLADGDDVNGYTEKLGNPTSNEAFTSGAIFGIFKDTLVNEINRKRGEIKIYANAYLKLDEANGGKILVADTTTGDEVGYDGFDGIAWSLKDVLVKLNNATLSQTQQTQIRDFYDQWNIGQFGWELNNIATWEPTPSEAA